MLHVEYVVVIYVVCPKVLWDLIKITYLILMYENSNVDECCNGVV
jgi:hypothetical protein